MPSRESGNSASMASAKCSGRPCTARPAFKPALQGLSIGASRARLLERPQMTNAYFLYHSIGMYRGKDGDLAAAMTGFADVWGRADDGQ